MCTSLREATLIYTVLIDDTWHVTVGHCQRVSCLNLSAELYLCLNKISEAEACVTETSSIFPLSHQVYYMVSAVVTFVKGSCVELCSYGHPLIHYIMPLTRKTSVSMVRRRKSDVAAKFNQSHLWWWSVLLWEIFMMSSTTKILLLFPVMSQAW